MTITQFDPNEARVWAESADVKPGVRRDLRRAYRRWRAHPDYRALAPDDPQRGPALAAYRTFRRAAAENGFRPAAQELAVELGKELARHGLESVGGEITDSLVTNIQRVDPEVGNALAAVSKRRARELGGRGLDLLTS